MKINFDLRGIEMLFDSKKDEDALDRIGLNWQETRKLSIMLLAVIENIDKHRIESGSIEK